MIEVTGILVEVDRETRRACFSFSGRGLASLPLDRGLLDELAGAEGREFRFTLQVIGRCAEPIGAAPSPAATATASSESQ